MPFFYTTEPIWMNARRLRPGRTIKIPNEHLLLDAGSGDAAAGRAESLK
jgi:hypothetical protein